MVWLEHLIDRLPARLWAPGNLYLLPGGPWHFCVGRHPTHERSVRTVEWRGHEVAHGHDKHPFKDEHVADVEPDEFVRLWRWGYWPGDRR